MQELKLVSPISPSVNHYMSARGIIKNKKPMAVMYETKEAKDYKKNFTKYVIKQAKLQNWEMSDNRYQHYYIDTTFYFPRVDLDCNNYWKCMWDSITDSECVWLDDTQACERVKHVYIDAKNPRIEMVIYPVDYIGIFDNLSQLEEFESNCIHCIKYREGKCNLLIKAKEGRIQEEISNYNNNNNDNSDNNNLICDKYKLKEK